MENNWLNLMHLLKITMIGDYRSHLKQNGLGHGLVSERKIANANLSKKN